MSKCDKMRRTAAFRADCCIATVDSIATSATEKRQRSDREKVFSQTSGHIINWEKTNAFLAVIVRKRTLTWRMHLDSKWRKERRSYKASALAATSWSCMLGSIQIKNLFGDQSTSLLMAGLWWLTRLFCSPPGT